MIEVTQSTGWFLVSFMLGVIPWHCAGADRNSRLIGLAIQALGGLGMIVHFMIL